MSQQDDDDRDAIEARRAKLVALALAGLVTSSAACGDGAKDESSTPRTCLTVTAPRTTPTVCLTMAPPDPPDAGPPPAPSSASSGADAGTAPPADAGVDAGNADAGSKPLPPPTPCLSKRPPPEVCLSVAPPKKTP